MGPKMRSSGVLVTLRHFTYGNGQLPVMKSLQVCCLSNIGVGGGGGGGRGCVLPGCRPASLACDCCALHVLLIILLPPVSELTFLQQLSLLTAALVSLHDASMPDVTCLHMRDWARFQTAKPW